MSEAVKLCKHGHEMTPENTGWKTHDAGGKLYPTCKICRSGINKMNIEASDKHRLAERERLFQRYQELRSSWAVAKEEGCAQVTIWNIISPHPDYKPLGISAAEPNFSADEVETIREMWAAGHSSSAIGRRLGRSKNSIVGKVHRLFLPARPSSVGLRHKRDIDWQRVGQLRQDGYGWDSVASALGLAPHALQHARKKHGGPLGMDAKFRNVVPRSTLAPLPSLAPRISPPRAPKPRAKEPAMIADQRQVVLPRVVTLAPLPAPIYAAPPPATRTCQFPTNNGEGMRWTFCDSPTVLPGKAYCRACYNRCYLRPTAEAAYAA